MVQPGPPGAAAARPPNRERSTCRRLVPDPGQLGRTLAHRARRNTRTGSRRNIAAHYDLGNDFYRLFLDESLTYSSAVFASPDQSLADAQREQVPHVAPNARPAARAARPGDRDGLGRVRAVCRRRARLPRDDDHHLARAVRAGADRVCARLGSTHLIDVQLRDYRDIEGTYDAIVSIEMLEAVGAEYLGTFFETCDRALRPGGRLSLQVITFPDAAYERQLRGANWIQTYIFPGGLCPSLATIERATRQTRALVTGVDRHRRRLRPDAALVARGIPRSGRRRAGARASTTVHPDVGVLPRPQRGRLRDRSHARTCRSCFEKSRGMA